MKTPSPCVWWKAPKNDAHAHVMATVTAIENEQAQRKAANRRAKLLYGDERKPYTLYGREPGIPVINPRRDAWGNISSNLCRMAADSLTAKIAAGQPKPTFVTDGGSWSQRRRAERLDHFVFGTFHESGLYTTAPRCFLDGTVKDIGAVKGHIADGKIRLERVLPDEIKVGALDGLYGKPRSIFHVTLVARELVLSWVDEWHKDKPETERLRLREAVRQSASGVDRESHYGALLELGDVVMVMEGWHLPSSEEAKDGRHVIAVSKATLEDEEWTVPRFPFAFFRFHQRDEGFYGQGAVEMLEGEQRAVNSICRTIADAARLMSVPRYWTKTGGDFEVRQLTNEVGSVITSIEPPQLLASNAIPPELFNLLLQTKKDALEKVGLNELAIAGRKPSGLDSGVALREHNDIQSDRFSVVHKRYDDFFHQAGQLVVDLATMAEARGVPLKATLAPGKRGRMVRGEWDKAKLDADTYVLKVHSSSALPQTPAARKEWVDGLYRDNHLDQTEYLRLLNLPDLQEHTSLAAAARDDIDAIVEAFLDGDDDKGLEDVYEAPEPFQDLAYGVKRMQLEALRAKRLEAPRGRVELLLRWASQAQEMLDEAAASAAPPPAEAAPAGVPPMPVPVAA